MPAVEDNWIETSAIGSRLVSWKVVRAGQIIHADEWAGNDPTGLRAYRRGLDWVEAHYPGTPFHWRHQALAWTIRAAAESIMSRTAQALPIASPRHECSPTGATWPAIPPEQAARSGRGRRAPRRQGE